MNLTKTNFSVRLMTLSLTCALGGLTGCGNRPPIALDQQIQLAAGDSDLIFLSGRDPDFDRLRYTVTALPAHGQLLAGDERLVDVPWTTMAPAHGVTYVSDPQYTGPDDFTYYSDDGLLQRADAVVSIHVNGAISRVRIAADTTLGSLTVPAGTTTVIDNNAVITVEGNARIDGQLLSSAGRLSLHVGGDLTIAGTLRANVPDDHDRDDTARLDSQPCGIHLVVAGDVNFSRDAIIDTNGDVVLTDDSEVLSRTPGALFDAVETVPMNMGTTLVPLPPGHPALQSASTAAPPRQVAQLLPAVTVSGRWFPPPAPGVWARRSIVIVRFNGPRDVNLDDLTIHAPPPAPPRDIDRADGPGRARDGRDGRRLLIENNGGAITASGAVELHLADGSTGDSETAVCKPATGGDGGAAGNLRMSAATHIDLTRAQLRIIPGRAGDGGDATVNRGPAAPDGCPGSAGDAATATAGNGAHNRKQLLARGDVRGVANVTIDGPIIGGDGGDAEAEACDGGNGDACCAAGAGGAGRAIGGRGGDASLNLNGLPADASGADALAGFGGQADATGGMGGTGGDCKFGDGGAGGAGGGATVRGGAGGDAGHSVGGVADPGFGGAATATAGDGGDGGASGFGDPGDGGAAGIASATGGPAGAGADAGGVGVDVEVDGIGGNDGGRLPVTLFCFGFKFVLNDAGAVAPGPQDGPVFDERGDRELGSMEVTFADIPGASYRTGDDPAHIYLATGARLDIAIDTLDLDPPPPGVIGGVRLDPYFGEGIDDAHPLIVEALDADGELIGRQAITEVPFNDPASIDHDMIDVMFEVSESVTTFRIMCPEQAAVALFGIYLLDP